MKNTPLILMLTAVFLLASCQNDDNKKQPDIDARATTNISNNISTTEPDNTKTPDYANEPDFTNVPDHTDAKGTTTAPDYTKAILSRDECLRLLELGIDEIPKAHLTSSNSASEDDISVIVATIKLEDSRTISFIRIATPKEIKVFALEEQLQENTEIALSTLDDQLLIGLSWHSGNTLKASFHSFKDGALHPFEIDNWVHEREDVELSNNKLSIRNAGDISIHCGKSPVLFRFENENALLYSIIHFCYEHSTAKTNTKTYELRFVFGFQELKMLSEQYIELNDRWEDPRPFDENIPGILEQNVDVLKKKPWTVPLPDGYACLFPAFGDLNADGIDDIAVVVEQMPGFEIGSRALYILLSQKDGRFKVRWQDGSIMGRGGGGVWGDPFEGVDIEKETLTISYYGGSSERWGFSASYSIQNDELILIRAEELRESTHALTGTRVIYYPETGIIEERSQTDKRDEFHDLLLFSDSTQPGQIYKFDDDVPYIWGLERNNGQHPPLPSLYGIDYGEQVWDNVNLTASEALDLVQKSLYPTLKKVPHPYSKEIMDNYSAILAYEVPDYSYVGENESLLYIGQSDKWHSDVLFHRISAYDFENKSEIPILVNDITGEITLG